MKKLKIAKSWFYSAGMKYGWQSDGLDVRGVGINKDVLFENESIIVEVDGVEYLLDCKQAIAFINKYKSHYTMPLGTKIGVISKDVLEIYA